MRDFKYEIQPGLKEFRTTSSRLFLVARRVPPTSSQHFATQVMAAPVVGEPGATWISLLYNPAKLAKRELWHDIHKQNPASLATSFSAQVEAGMDKVTRLRAVTLLTQFGLAAVSGVLQQPRDDGAIDAVAYAIPAFDEEAMQASHQHVSSQGVLKAHLQRQVAI